MENYPQIVLLNTNYWWSIQ